MIALLIYIWGALSVAALCLLQGQEWRKRDLLAASLGWPLVPILWAYVTWHGI